MSAPVLCCASCRVSNHDATLYKDGEDWYCAADYPHPEDLVLG